MWKKYPDDIPKISGYYLTYYYSSQSDVCFIKALWYSIKDKEWIWRVKPEVICYYDEQFDYYAPCQMQEGIDLVPVEWRMRSDRRKSVRL